LRVYGIAVGASVEIMLVLTHILTRSEIAFVVL